MSLEAHVNRKRLIAGISILAILVIAAVGFLFARSKNSQPQAHRRLPVSNLGYCGSNNSKPCIVSFSLDADGNMLVNLLTPKSSYPAFYLTISNVNIENRYECLKVKGFPTNVYCTGRQMDPGEALQFNIISTKDDIVLAEGNFAIIGLLLATPNTELTATDSPSATEPLIILEILTPVATELTPSYPNSSYPNPSYP